MCERKTKGVIAKIGRKGGGRRKIEKKESNEQKKGGGDEKKKKVGMLGKREKISKPRQQERQKEMWRTGRETLREAEQPREGERLTTGRRNVKENPVCVKSG